MDCSQFQDDMMDVLYGEADAETSARFEAHRHECADCRDEVSGFQRVRRDMQAWRFDMPRARRHYLPGLRGLAAAAAIVIAFAGGLTIARTEVRYREGELVVRFGGGPAHSPETSEMAQRLARLEAQQRQQTEALRTTALQPVASTGDANQDALLRQVQRMLQQSEARQYQRLQAGLSDLAAEHQRDLMMINTSFSQLQLETASDIERLGTATSNVLRINGK